MSSIKKEPIDIHWCYECNSIVDKGHRCEQWSNTTYIPKESIIEILKTFKLGKIKN